MLRKGYGGNLKRRYCIVLGLASVLHAWQSLSKTRFLEDSTQGSEGSLAIMPVQ